MVRKSLLAVLLLAIASPLAAQEDTGYTWTSKRPDAIAPGGVTNAEILSRGEIRFKYRFEDLRWKGLYLGTDSLPLTTALQSYSQAPISMDSKNQYVTVALGLTDQLTLIGTASYSHREREQQTAGGILYSTTGQQLGDTHVAALYEFLNQGGWRAHLQAGAILPTGEINVLAVTPFSTPNIEPLPYDMQIGAGSYAFVPGLTVRDQNDNSSVGAQFQGTFYFGDNSNHYRLGDRYELLGWAAYKISDYFSVSARVDWQHWGRINGARPGLNPAKDPGNDAYYLNGSRVDVPIGLNFYLPPGSRFAGQRATIELALPAYRNNVGAELGLDWGLNLGWQMSL